MIRIIKTMLAILTISGNNYFRVKLEFFRSDIKIHSLNNLRKTPLIIGEFADY